MELSYSNWEEGEPNRCCPNERALSAINYEKGWNDVNEYEQANVLCKYKSKPLLVRLFSQAKAIIFNKH